MVIQEINLNNKNNIKKLDLHLSSIEFIDGWNNFKHDLKLIVDDDSLSEFEKHKEFYKLRAKYLLENDCDLKYNFDTDFKKLEKFVNDNWLSFRDKMVKKLGIVGCKK